MKSLTVLIGEETLEKLNEACEIWRMPKKEMVERGINKICDELQTQTPPWNKEPV
jgi:hypothetical protein